MNSKNPYYALSLLVAISMILAACAPAATATEPPAVQETEAPVATEPVATERPTEEPTAEPTTRRGGWLDRVNHRLSRLAKGLRGEPDANASAIG